MLSSHWRMSGFPSSSPWRRNWSWIGSCSTQCQMAMRFLEIAWIGCRPKRNWKLHSTLGTQLTGTWNSSAPCWLWRTMRVCLGTWRAWWLPCRRWLILMASVSWFSIWISTSQMLLDTNEWICLQGSFHKRSLSLSREFPRPGMLWVSKGLSHHWPIAAERRVSWQSHCAHCEWSVNDIEKFMMAFFQSVNASSCCRCGHYCGLVHLSKPQSRG